MCNQVVKVEPGFEDGSSSNLQQVLVPAGSKPGAQEEDLNSRAELYNTFRGALTITNAEGLYQCPQVLPITLYFPVRFL